MVVGLRWDIAQRRTVQGLKDETEGGTLGSMNDATLQETSAPWVLYGFGHFD